MSTDFLLARRRDVDSGRRDCSESEEVRSRCRRPCCSFLPSSHLWLYHCLYRPYPLRVDCRSHPSGFHRCLYDWVRNQYRGWTSSRFDGNYWFQYSSSYVQGHHKYLERSPQDRFERRHGSNRPFLALRDSDYLQVSCKEVSQTAKDVLLHFHSSDGLCSVVIYLDQLVGEQTPPQEATL